MHPLRRISAAVVLAMLASASLGLSAVSANAPVPGAISLGGGSGQLSIYVVVNWHVDGSDTATISVSGPGINQVLATIAPESAYSATIPVAGGGTYTVTVTERYTAPDGTVSNYGPTSQSIYISAPPPPPTPAPTPVVAPPTSPVVAPPPPAPTPTPATVAPAPTRPPSSGGGSSAPAPRRSGSSVSCDSFAAQEEAQAYWYQHGWPLSDPAGLDPDGNGIACERLPSALFAGIDGSDLTPASGADETKTDSSGLPSRRVPDHRFTRFVDDARFELDARSDAAGADRASSTVVAPPMATESPVSAKAIELDRSSEVVSQTPANQGSMPIVAFVALGLATLAAAATAWLLLARRKRRVSESLAD